MRGSSDVVHAQALGTIAFKAATTVPAADVDSATIGSQVAVHVSDADLSGVSTVTVSVTSDTDPVGITVIVSQTNNPLGLLTGSFTLDPTSSSSAAGTLAAAAGDTVTATYTDFSTPFGVVSFTDSLLVVSPSDADLALTKTASPDPVDVGQSLTYTVTVTNAGPAEASGVTLTAVLTGGQTFSTATPTQGSCGESLGTVTCDLGTVAASATSTVTIVVTPSKAGLLGNTADVSSNANDPFATNNSATTITTVLDPSLVDTQGPQITNLSPPDGGILGTGPHVYSADIVDAGSGVDLDTAVFLVNAIADNMAFAIVMDPSFTSFTSIEDASGNIIGVTITMTGVTLTGDIWVTVRASGVAGNETIFDADAVTPGIQMARIVIDTSPPVLVDAFTGVWYDPVNRVLMYNDRKKIIVIFAEILTNLLPISVEATDFAVQNNTVVAADWYDSDDATSTEPGLGTVAIRKSVFLTLQDQLGLDETPTVTIVGDGVTDQAGNVMTVGSTTALDRVTALNTDLSVTKSDSRDVVIAATNLTYTLTVTNNGPSDATGIVVTDTLPSTLNFGSASSGCSHDAGTNQVTCSLGSLVNGATTAVTIEFTVVASSTAFVINNFATVMANEADPDATDNTVLETTTVIPYEGYPSLSWWSLIAMAVTMVLLVMWRLRRSRIAATR